MKIRTHYMGMLTLCFLYSIFFTYHHLMTVEWDRATFRCLVDGTATTPMQYRVLIPWIAHIMEKLIPVLPFIDHLNGIRFLLEFAAVFGLFTAFLWSTYSLLLDNYSAGDRTPPVAALWFALLLLMLSLPFHYLIRGVDPTFYYPSDIPSVAFFVIGCTAALRWRLFLFYAVFTVGAINRETTCFLTLFLLLVSWQTQSKKTLLLHVATQTIIWLGIKVWLFLLFSGNTNPAYCTAGGIFKMTLFANISSCDARLWVVLPSVYGFLWLPLLFVFRHIRPVALKRGLWLIPLFHIAMIIPGELFELRIYAEMLPVVVWGVVFGTARILSGAPSHFRKPSVGCRMVKTNAETVEKGSRHERPRR